MELQEVRWLRWGRGGGADPSTGWQQWIQPYPQVARPECSQQGGDCCGCTWGAEEGKLSAGGQHRGWTPVSRKSSEVGRTHAGRKEHMRGGGGEMRGARGKPGDDWLWLEGDTQVQTVGVG